MTEPEWDDWQDDWEPDPPTEEELALWLKQARSLPLVTGGYSIWQRRCEVLIHTLRAQKDPKTLETIL